MKPVSILFIFLITLNLSASVLLLDFGDLDTDPTVGGTWNTIETDTPSGLLYSDESAATGISISFSGLNAGTLLNGAWTAGNKAWVDEDAVSDYIWSTDPSTITISGLNDSFTYNVSLVAARNGGTNREGTYRVGGATTTDETSSLDIDVADSFINGTLLNWTSVSPSSGSISITAVPNSSQTVFFNAAQITAIPEPETLTLVGVAMVIFCVLRRRAS